MFDYALDIPYIDAYNARRKPTSPTLLQTHMGPAPYDGDPCTASVVLLMNNPGYDPATSTAVDHALRFDGWPIAGLHPSVPSTFRKWYDRPLGYLLTKWGHQHVSQRVCLLQLCPWASTSFDIDLILPSRSYQMSLAYDARKRGAIVIVGRSSRLWPSEWPRASNVRNPRLAPSSLDPQTWASVEAAMA